MLSLARVFWFSALGCKAVQVWSLSKPGIHTELTCCEAWGDLLRLSEPQGSSSARWE